MRTQEGLTNLGWGMIKSMNRKAYGFTIVELLIVIVVVGILAAISIVAYNGLSGQAYDSSVQQDLRNMAQKFELYRVEKGAWPVSTVQVKNAGVSIAKDAYGSHHNGIYNLLYCRMPDGSGDMALIAGSKSGNKFVYSSVDGADECTGPWSGGYLHVCPSFLGLPSTDGSHRTYFFFDGAWVAPFN